MSRRVDAIRTMLARDPADVFLHYSLGMELAGEGDFPAATEAFEACIRLDPAYLPAYVERAKALRSAGQRDQARAVFEQAMTLAKSQKQTHVANYIRQQLEGLAP